MNSLQIKHEFESDCRLQCRSCLSIGRKLAPLGQYTNIYMKLTADFVLNHPSEPIEICWECLSLLRKVIRFQEHAKAAYELFLNNQNFTYGPLSNLGSITFNDTYQTVYLNEYNVQNNLKSVKSENIIFKHDLIEHDLKEAHEKGPRKINENVFHVNDTIINKCDESSHIKDDGYIKLRKYVIRDNNKNVHEINSDTNKDITTTTYIPPLERFYITQHNDNNIGCDTNNEIRNKHDKNKVFNNENTCKEDDFFENDFLYEKPKLNNTSDLKTAMKSKKPKSRWAIKRAACNKKPKFKLISKDLGEAFTKEQINNEELTDCMEEKSEYFNSKRFKFQTCIKGFDEEKKWLAHNEVHHCDKLGLEDYTCDICKTKITDKRHLLSHIKQHYLVYKCTICQYICKNKETRVSHLQNMHKKTFRCLKCGLKFCNRREFYKHHKDWHEKYICHHCGVSFKMRYCIKEHIRKQHSPFTCVPCSKTFARYNGLWLHNKLAHSPPTPPAYCVECNTTYKDIYRYKWHLLNSPKHTPKKKVSIPCPECEKTFSKKIYMKDHYNFVHLKLCKYRCAPCDKNFTRNAELVKHRRRKHEGILPPKNKICNLCGKGFTTNKILRNHIRTHEKHDSNISSEDKLKEKTT